MNVKVIGDNNYLGDLQEEFFKNRGISDYENFVSLKGFKETDPFSFINMKESVDLLVSMQGMNVGIIVDSDIDGLSSASSLNNYLQTYMDFNIKLSIHRRKTHGIKFDELQEDGILDWADILIVPDAGSEDYEQHKRLKEEYGIITMVYDHHSCPYRSEHAIVINNQLDNISTKLTGSGMVYKLLQALDIELSENGADDFIDLTALGLIGDMADVRDYEVQSLIRKGIKKIENPLFLSIVENDYNINENRISGTTLAFSIIPMLNACTRVAEYEEMKIVVEALCNIDTERVFEYTPSRGKNKGETIEEDLYQYAHRVAKSCKARQDSMVKKALEGGKRPPRQGLFDWIQENDIIKDNGKIIVLDITNFADDSGLSGLIANKLMYHYNRPTLVFTKKEDGYLGSGRGEQIQFLRTKLEDSKLVKSANGHEPAFGVRLKEGTDLKKLNEDLDKYFESESSEAQHVVDFHIPIDYLEDYMVDDLAKLEEFFGTGLKAPKIYIDDVEVLTQSIDVGKNNNIIKFTKNDIDFVMFKVSEEKMEKLVDWSEYVCYNIVAEPSINEYEGKRIVQLIIKDMECTSIKQEKISDEDWGNTENEDTIEW